MPESWFFEKRIKDKVKEGIEEGELEGRLLGTGVMNFGVSGDRCHGKITLQRTKSVPEGAKRAIVYLGSYWYRFGKRSQTESKVGEILLDYGINSFRENKLQAGLDFALKDKHGDKSFKAKVELLVLYFS